MEGLRWYEILILGLYAFVFFWMLYELFCIEVKIKEQELKKKELEKTKGG